MPGAAQLLPGLKKMQHNLTTKRAAFGTGPLMGVRAPCSHHGGVGVKFFICHKTHHIQHTKIPLS